MPKKKHTKQRATKMHHTTATKSARFANGVGSNRTDHNNRMSGVMGEATRARNTGTPTNRPVPGNGAGVMAVCPTGYYKCPAQTQLAGSCVQSRAECAGVGTRGGDSGNGSGGREPCGPGMKPCQSPGGNIRCVPDNMDCPPLESRVLGGTGVRTMSSYRRGGRTRRTRRRR